jgi:hypothetical protein
MSIESEVHELTAAIRELTALLLKVQTPTLSKVQIPSASDIAQAVLNAPLPVPKGKPGRPKKAVKITVGEEQPTVVEEVEDNVVEIEDAADLEVEAESEDLLEDEAAPAKQEEPVTREKLLSILVNYRTVHGPDALKKLLKSHGAAVLSDLDPSKYAAVAREAA